MGEILKQGQSGDRPERGRRDEEQVSPRLRIKLRQVDFVSPLGAFRARESRPAELELAPGSSEVWVDWRKDLGRRITRTAVRAEELMSEFAETSS